MYLQSAERWSSRKGRIHRCAWLSSARAVRCWVKSRNERNPTLSCHPARGHSKGTADDKSEEGGDEVKSSWPLYPGLHTYYNGYNSGEQSGDMERILKSSLNTDCSLQLDYMKLESLVIAGQQNRGEYVLGPCTHRPSHHPSWFFLKLVTPTARGRLVKEELVRRVKS